jgi:hypothetical protein
LREPTTCRASKSSAKPNQADPPLTTAPRRRASVAEPEEAAKLAIARRAKPGAPSDHVRLVLTLDLRRALAEQLSAQAIRSGKNLEAIITEQLEAGAKRWR